MDVHNPTVADFHFTGLTLLSTKRGFSFGSPSVGSGAVVTFLPFIDDFLRGGAKKWLKKMGGSVLPDFLWF
jgi:hypothetical protein